MRKLSVLLLSAMLVACSGSDSITGPVGVAECSNDGQKQFVLDNLYAWYLWNNLLPSNIDIADYPSPEQLVYDVTTTYGPQDANDDPIDRWSSVGSLQADQQYFGEGKYEGFGFRFNFINFLPPFQILGTFADSPAGASALERGQTVITLNGRTPVDIQAAEGIDAFFDNTDTVTFVVEDLQGNTLPPIEITKGIVTIDPIPQYRVIDMGPGEPPVGYIEFVTCVSTADPVFGQVFAEFNAAGVEDVIIDMRYNGGGLVATANLLGDYLGGFANDGQIFSNTEFNADRAAANNSIDYFANRANAIDINRLIIVATRGTASASELVINGLDPFVTDGVYIVGDNTYGKPVGQVGLEFCEKILRPTSFKKSNAAGYGDYFDGLPVDCVATDDLDFPVGDANDPNMIAALSYINGAGCPVVAAQGGQQKADAWLDQARPDLTGPPEREFAGAY